MLSCFCSVRLFVTSWTVACQTPLSMGFSRQEYWSGLSCPPPRDLPDAGIESMSHVSCLVSRFFTTSSTAVSIVARPQHSPDINLSPITQKTPSFPLPAPGFALGEALSGKALCLAFFSQHAAIGAVSWLRVGSRGQDVPARVCLFACQWTSGNLLCVFVFPGLL